jgi:hypothetical protein
VSIAVSLVSLLSTLQDAHDRPKQDVRVTHERPVARPAGLKNANGEGIGDHQPSRTGWEVVPSLDDPYSTVLHQLRTLEDGNALVQERITQLRRARSLALRLSGEEIGSRGRVRLHSAVADKDHW